MTATVELDENVLLTPNGHSVRFLFRRDSSDHNTIHSASTFDEYSLRGLQLEGWALDLGSHVGAVGICLAVDHPNLTVICVEPVPDNAQLIREHAEMNDVADRVVVIEAAIGEARSTTKIRYGFRQDGEFDHHAWVGNTSLVYATPPVEPHDEVEVDCLDLLAQPLLYGLISAAGTKPLPQLVPPALIKVDAEGGEWGCLKQLVQLRSPRVVGEWHPVCGRTRADELVHAFVDAGYHVNVTGPVGGPGGFTATR